MCVDIGSNILFRNELNELVVSIPDGILLFRLFEDSKDDDNNNNNNNDDNDNNNK